MPSDPLPRLPRAPKKEAERPPLGSTFDITGAHLDPCAGWLIGACEIIRRLSPGSMNSLLAQREDRGQNALVVLKKVEATAKELPELQHHAQAVQAIEHANLAHVFAPESAEEGVFWVTEFVSGASLSEVRAACKKAGKSLPLGLVFATVHEAAQALGELHARGLGHGELKDANVLATFAGSAKVLSPGVSDCLHRLPPDPRADVAALATLMYTCLTGQALAPGPFAPPSSFNHALEPAIDELLLRALGPDRSKRFANGADFAKALKQASSAFMWKPAQRAEFVGSLYKMRKQREQVLIAQAAQRIAVRRSGKHRAMTVSAELPIVAGELLEEPVQVAPQESDPAVDTPPPPLPVERDRERSRRRTYAIAAAGAAAALAVVLGLALKPTPPIPAPPVIVMMAAPPPVTPTPAPVPAPAAEATAPAVAEAEAAPQADAEKAAVKVAVGKRKKHADDAPLPPWLQPRKGRR
jgi:hypothetical protein